LIPKPIILSHVKPVNKVLIAIPKAFEDEIVTDSGFRLFKDSSFQKEWNASIVGTVSALSDLVSDQNKSIYDELDLGMTIACDYKVIADFDYVSDAKHFHSSSSNRHLPPSFEVRYQNLFRQ